MSYPPISPETCIVRDTGGRKGRHIAVAPGTTATQHLRYGRIVLDAGDAPVRFETGECETGLICLNGVASVRVGDQTFRLDRLDSIYAPKGSRVEVSCAGDRCDLAELSAPVQATFPVQVVRYADVQKDASLHFKAGAAASQREVNILIGKNVQAGRILAGVTFSATGNWTSWPPHEHAAMLEEAYVYIDMPPPSFGLQMVYTDRDTPELVAMVREGDCVLMPKGYHPNVAAPGGSINFLWMMAAHRELEDRQFGVVNVQPEFAATSSGLDPARADKK
jgi:5-deoxy-glucuronate isomerase